MTTTASEESSVELPWAEGKFYGVDPRKATLREFGFEAKNPLQWLLVMQIAMGLKLFRAWIPSSPDDVPVESLEPFLTTGEAFPGEVWEKMAPVVAEMQGLGFEVAGYYLIEDAAHVTTTYYVVLAGPRNVVGRVHARIWRQSHPPKFRVYSSYVTRFRGGGWVWSSSGAADFLWPRECRMVRKVGAVPGELLRLHEEAVGKERDVVVPAADALEVVEAHHGVVTGFHLGRGVFTQALHPTEAARVEKARARGAGHAEGGVGSTGGAAAVRKHPLILDEIEKIQNAKAGWGKTLALLALSAAIFVVAGRNGWAKQDFLYLIPILFVHELGHYLTMRMFGYRNLRMFFIPFLGAAVTGRNYNVAGWKKGVVALMGPVPGIGIGVAVGMIGWVKGDMTMLHVALLLLLINGLNLIPVLPLDGGHVFQTVLFARHYVLDLVFRIVAAISLVGIAVLLGGKVMIYVAIALAVGIPMAFRLAKAAYELKQAGVSGASDDSQTIPPEVAERIIDKLMEGRQRPVANRMMAQQVLTVFEGLNARPPGWAGSILLLATQGGAVVAAAASALLFVIAMRGGFAAWGRQARAQPAHAVGMGPVEEWRGAGFAFHVPAERRTVVGTLASESAATAAMEKVEGIAPGNAEIRRFGETVFVSMPGESKGDASRMFDGLSAVTKDVFVETKDQGASTKVTGIAVSDEEATGVREELSEYFQSLEAGEDLIPPWEATRWCTAEAYAGYRRARGTLAKMHKAMGDVYSDPTAKAATAKVTEARKRGDMEGMAAAIKESTALHERLMKERLEAFRTSTDAGIDQGVVEEVLSLKDAKGRAMLYGNFSAEGMKRLGVMPAEALKTAEHATGAKWGAVAGTGMFVNVFATFEAGEEGLPAMCEWLQAKRCVGLKYEVSGTSLNPEDME